jgi:diguanylate cyclase (GGDEF)-like protein/PAS domain S-box-containing protein
VDERVDTFALAAIAIAAGLVLGVGGWLQPYRPVDFCGLIVAAILVSALAKRQPIAEERGTMPFTFVIDFAALLLFGPGPAMVVASAGTILKGRLADSERVEPSRQTLFAAVIAVVAIQAAGLAHRTLGGTTSQFAWPAQGLPIAAALVAYVSVKGGLLGLVTPLLARRPVNRAWATTVLRECPSYFIGASLAVGLAEALHHRMWGVFPVAAVPLYFTYRVYTDYVSRLEDEHRHREIVDYLDQGLSVVDSQGRVTLWQDSVERLVGCPREEVLGRPLVNGVPGLPSTALPQAITDVLKDRSPRMLSVPSSDGARTLQVKILPVADGVALLWSDITERTGAEQSLKRSTERFALAAEGANDGLWEWNLRTGEFYCSGRWKAMLGLPARAGVGRPEEWINRVHPDDAASLKGTLKALVAGTPFQHEHRIRHEDGAYRSFLCRGVAGGTGRHPSRIAGSLTDITERVIAQERVRTSGFLDPLTGLRNRVDFLESLGHRLEEFKRQPSDGRFAVLYLDLDRFKLVNDSLGHMVGDELLIAVSRRLESCLRQEDCLGRLGGDEFAILLNAVGDEQQANAIAFRIQDSLSTPLSVGGREVFTSASIGIAFGRVQYTSPDEIMRDADTAMYHAKSRGKARHELFDAEMLSRAKDRLNLENDLRRAINANDFEVHYQPIVSLDSGMCVGFESLVRWTRDGEKVSPATFVPIAEELGLIEPLGTWVLNQACETFADWQRRFPEAGLNCITVNASSRQLTQPNFPHLVEQALQKSGLKPCDLRIEVTETALMDSPHLAAQVLSQLRDFGVKIYLDDFGTGCSSLSHLHKLPVDALKIDRSFVNSLLLPDRPAIVESILALARTLNTSVVAEGIESEVQARELVRLGCTHAQGYLFSRPLSMQAAEAVIAANQPLGPKPVLEVGATGSGLHQSRTPVEWTHPSVVMPQTSSQPALTAP